jgi:hypothetical protein
MNCILIYLLGVFLGVVLGLQTCKRYEDLLSTGEED